MAAFDSINKNPIDHSSLLFYLSLPIRKAVSHLSFILQLVFLQVNFAEAFSTSFAVSSDVLRAILEDIDSLSFLFPILEISLVSSLRLNELSFIF